MNARNAATAIIGLILSSPLLGCSHSQSPPAPTVQQAQKDPALVGSWQRVSTGLSGHPITDTWTFNADGSIAIHSETDLSVSQPYTLSGTYTAANQSIILSMAPQHGIDFSGSIPYTIQGSTLTLTLTKLNTALSLTRVP